MVRTDPTLAAYRAATHLLTPVAPAFLAWRQAKGKEDPDRMAERLGMASLPRPPGRLVWTHGASVGESLALLPMVRLLVERGFHVLMSTGTVTSSRVIGSRLPPGATHQFAPIDLPKYMRRFLTHWRPDLLLLAESELWPNLICEAARRRVPIVLVNARMSQRSARRWLSLSGFIGSLLARTDLCLAQTRADARRFARLGAAKVEVTGSMKFDAPPPTADPQEVAEFSALVGARPVWVAASTHAGEEEVAAVVHKALSATFPDLLTIIAPRHPNRGQEVAAVIQRHGLRAALRSRGEKPDRKIQVYVADTIGDLGLFYRLATVVFLGKSLAPGGGQNPIEPAKLGCAVLHGPLVQNFEEIYQALDDAEGAIRVDSAEALSAVLADLLSNAARLRSVARAAAETIEGLAGATRRTMAAIEPFLAMALAQGSG